MDITIGDVVASVDDEDYQLLVRRKWCIGNTGYPMTAVSGAGMVTMHSIIMPCKRGCMVDHIDRNKLNNTKENLRLVVARENIQNKSKRKSCPFPYKGIRPSTGGDKWSARIVHQRKEMHLGVFDTAEDAARAYDAKASELYGTNAFTNFGGK